MISKKKLLLLAILTALTFFFWNSDYLLPVKLFVVYLHEISHAVAALLSGGKVHSILVNFDESGLTHTQNGNFLVMALAGYIGSAVFGSAMLYASLSGRFVKTISTLIGVVIVYFTIFYSEQMNAQLYYGFLLCGFTFILLSVFYDYGSRLFLFFGGGLTSFYAVFDLSDFWGGSIMSTDAGIIATRYVQDESIRLIFAYSIASLIAIISIWLMLKILHFGMRIQEQPSPELTEEDYEQAEGHTEGGY